MDINQKSKRGWKWGVKESVQRLKEIIGETTAETGKAASKLRD